MSQIKIPNPKSQTNSNYQNIKHMEYDLEERTEQFARDIRKFVKTLPRTISNIRDVDQLVRSSGSQAANYIEANESLSKKDFLHRMKICRKEAKESRLWLRLINTGNNQPIDKQRDLLIQEAEELLKIFGTIIEKSK